MKRVGRYFKWLFSGMGWFEWFMLSTSFFLGGGVMAIIQGNEGIRDTMFTIALCITGIGMIVFMYKGIRFSWEQFKKDDEKVFDILKQKDIK